MVVGLDICVYCERNPDELVSEQIAICEDMALDWVNVAEHRVQLCTECRLRYAPSAQSLLDEWISGPVEFPPGVTAVEHCCPQLQFDGRSDEEATFVVEMQRVGRYYQAHCPHCGIEVRSLAEEEVE